MKKLLLIISLMIVAITAMSQDRIVRKNGEVVLAKIISVNDLDLHYYAVMLDGEGQYVADESTAHVMMMEKVESVTLASGKQLYLSKHANEGIASHTPASPYIVPQYKNPAAAYFCSFIPGVGQFYNDEISKGFGYMAATLIEGVVIGIAACNLTTTENYTQVDSYYPYSSHTAERQVTNETAKNAIIITSIVYLITHISASIDAVTTANRLNLENGYLLKVRPSVNYNAATHIPTAGLSLSLSF